MGFGLALVLLIPIAVAVAYRASHSEMINDSLVSQLFAGAALFVVAGPLIGGVVYFVLSVIFRSGIAGTSSFYLENPGIALVGAYAFFGVPVLVAGCVAGALVPFIKSWRQCLFVGLASFPISLLWSGAFSNPLGFSFQAAVHWVLTGKGFDLFLPLCVFVPSVLLSRVLRIP